MRYVLVSLAMVACLPGVSLAGFLAAGGDGVGGYLVNQYTDAGAFVQTIWSGGTSPGAIATNPANGHIFLGLSGSGVYESPDNGANWTYVFGANTSPAAAAVKGDMLYVSLWNDWNDPVIGGDGAIVGWDLVSNVQGPTINLWTPTPPGIGAKSQQLLVGPDSVNNDLLMACFYGDTWGAGVVRWDGVSDESGLSFVCRTPNGYPSYGLASDGETDLYLTQWNGWDEVANNCVAYWDLAEAPGGVSAVWKDYGAGLAGPQVHNLLAMNGVLYVATSANGGQIERISLADGSPLGSTPLTAVAKLAAFVISEPPERMPGDVHAEGQEGYGCVDGADYTIWADNYDTSGHPTYSNGGWSVGNFTDDDTVDGADYTVWADHYLQGCGGQVPEPFSGLLILVAAPLLMRRRNRMA